MKVLSGLNDLELDAIILNAPGWNAIAFLSYGSQPCVFFRPEFESFAQTFKSKIFSGWLDVDENPTITEQLKVVALPTLVIYKDGEEVSRYEGPYSRESLAQRVGALVSPKKSKGKE